MKTPHMEARLFLTDKGMPYVSYWTDSMSWSQWEEKNLYYVCTIDLMYFDYADENMYSDGKPKVCKILKECAWDIERELKAYIDTFIDRYCE